jgi:SEC-C motif domain protein
LGIAKPQTAEELMRSRYSAFATADIEYILRSTHPSTRKHTDSEAILEWARSSVWQKLEVISTEKGTPKDSKGIVEFKAFYLDSNSKPHVHHEISTFAKELGKWFFVDGRSPETTIP